MADEPAHRRDDVDERQRKERVEYRSAGDVTQRPKTGIEGDAVEQEAQNAERQEQQQLKRARQHTKDGKHISRERLGTAAPMRSHAESLVSLYGGFGPKARRPLHHVQQDEQPHPNRWSQQGSQNHHHE
jgi:hypothetical protein